MTKEELRKLLNLKYGISPYNAAVLSDNQLHANYVIEMILCSGRIGESLSIVNYFLCDVKGYLNLTETTIEDFPLTPEESWKLLSFSQQIGQTDAAFTNDFNMKVVHNRLIKLENLKQ